MNVSIKVFTPALALFVAIGAYSQSSRSTPTPQSLGINVGTTFCDSMTPNSSGLSTTLTGQFGSGTGSGLHLEATQGPVGQFGYFRVGTNLSEPGVALSQGRLCLAIGAGNVIGRYTVPGNANSIGQFGANGVLLNLAGTSLSGTGFDVPSIIPISGSPMITAGDTWHFQLIHREDGGNWNYSNGLSVTF